MDKVSRTGILSQNLQEATKETHEHTTVRIFGLRAKNQTQKQEWHLLNGDIRQVQFI